MPIQTWRIRRDRAVRMDVDMQGEMDLEATAPVEGPPTGPPLSYTGRRRDWDRLRDQCYEGLVAGDETAVRRVFERLWLARVPLLDQAEQLLAPALSRLGEACEAGAVSRARCRVASGICERMLAWAVSCLDAPAVGAPLALIVTPKGDDQRLPALMIGAVLRHEGWTVRQIDHMAVSEVVDLARRLRASAAVISFTLPRLAGTADALRDRLGELPGVAVVVGGPGATLRGLQQQLAAVHLATPAGTFGELESLN